MCIAGGLGIPGTRKERSTSRNAFAGVFMGFSITSAILGGVIVIYYSFAIARLRDKWNFRSSRYGDDLSPKYRRIFTNEMALSVTILILGIVGLVIGIWAVVCLCQMKPCTCCSACTCCYGNPPQQRQAMYTANTGYVMTQAPAGVPVATPMQAGGGIVAVQAVTPGAQEGQLQMVMIPYSGAEGYQPQLIQVASAGAMVTGCQVQQAEMPPPYEQGQLQTQLNK
ncbi:hypothetical protein ACROYT_G022765 [Oculina patagonica]